MKFLVILLSLIPSLANAGSYVSYTMMNSGDMSGAILAGGVDAKLLNSSAIQVIYNGTPAGTMVAQVSNDNVPPGLTTPSSNVVNWVDLPGSSTSPSIQSGSSGTLMAIANMGFRWIRLKYTPSGSLPQSCNSCRITVNFFGHGD